MNDMGVALSGKSKGELLSELNRYLISQYAQRSTVVLVVDEAHLLSWELLEEIRLLTNLETEQQKLLQIVLFGQPELDEKLDCAELRQLKQRIGLRCRLMPLTRDDTQKYIALRLWLAGATDRHQTLFSEPAVELIHQYSGGIPRLVNTICEAALIASFAVKSPTVLPQIIDEIAEEFCLYNASPLEKKRAGRAEPNVAQGAGMDIALEAL
jgi:type II secretory pathway predicted ATPase ExeA